MKQIITCVQCGDTFVRKNGRGPIPSYCSQSCRQRAYEVRTFVRRNDGGKAYRFVVAETGVLSIVANGPPTESHAESLGLILSPGTYEIVEVSK